MPVYAHISVYLVTLMHDVGFHYQLSQKIKGNGIQHIT